MEWRYRRGPKDCEACKSIMRRLNKEAPCDTCEIVRISPDNNIIDYLISKYGSMFTNGMGGINPDGIRLVLELEEDIIEDKQDITYKLLTYMRVALDAQNKEHTDGGKNNKT